MIRVHATCVSVGGAGVLLRGASGSGKSDLALRLVDAGALLVADDQVALAADPTATLLTATAPERLAGLIEVRGLGILPA
ncbi:HPr kinase/phosphorylase, partial [Nitrospirillum viridazoti]